MEAYLLHDANAGSNLKLMIMIQEEGMKGYGIYWTVLEFLRLQNEYKASLKVIPILAQKARVTTATLKRIIYDYALFEVNETSFSSPGLSRRMEPWDAQQEAKKEAGRRGGLVNQQRIRDAKTSSALANKLNKDKITDDISSKSYDYSNKRYNKYDMAEQYIDYRSQQGDVYFFYKGDDDIAYFYPYSKDHLNALENGKSLKKYASEGYMNVKNYLIQMGLTNQEASQMIEYNLLNKQDINTRLEFSKIYMKNGLKGYISPGKIDDTFEKIKIYDTREEFEKAYHGPHPETIMGFNRRGTMNLPPEVSTSTIIHEANHSLGDLRGKMNLTDEYRGTNEAFTEEIARKLSRGDFHSRGYQSMTDALELVNNKLNEKGYGNLDLQAYFTGSAKGLKEYYKAVDSVGGKGFCDEFFKALNDVHDTVFSKTRQVVGSKANLNALVQYFISR